LKQGAGDARTLFAPSKDIKDAEFAGRVRLLPGLIKEPDREVNDLVLFDHADVPPAFVVLKGN
jgi:hypothetical protein